MFLETFLLDAKFPSSFYWKAKRGLFATIMAGLFSSTWLCTHRRAVCLNSKSLKELEESLRRAEERSNMLEGRLRDQRTPQPQVPPIRRPINMLQSISFCCIVGALCGVKDPLKVLSTPSTVGSLKSSLIKLLFCLIGQYYCVPLANRARARLHGTCSPQEGKIFRT